MSPVAALLRNIVRDPARLRLGEPLARHTTFRIGGPADIFVQASDAAELQGILGVAREHGVPLLILGNGSNVLVADAGVRGIVLGLAAELAGCRIDGSQATAGGGYDLPRLAAQAVRHGLGGLTFACAIPGTVGAGIVINAGAHGYNLSQRVMSVAVVYPDGKAAVLAPHQIGFAYRQTGLLNTGAIVTSAVFGLFPADPERLRREIKGYIEHRRQTQPLDHPNAGSVFKNPPGQFAGRLIDEAGCKGWREGNAAVSEKHANFVVNLGRATAAEVITLMQRIRDRVYEYAGITLEPEIRIWGANLGG